MKNSISYNHPSLVNALLAFPLTIFSTLVWLRRERDALAMADLAAEPALRALILSTVAQALHERADVEQQEILLLLAQARSCLVSLPAHKRIDALLRDLVKELTLWQQWSVAREVADAINTPLYRHEAQSSIVNQLLEAGLWEEALTEAPSVENRIVVYTRMHAWEAAEEAVQALKSAAHKIDALCMLARELAAASETLRAEALWRQAVQIASEGAVSNVTLANLSEDLARSRQWELAETVASLLRSLYPGSQEAGSELDHQIDDYIDSLWLAVLRARVLATLAGEYTKACRWERVETRWEEAQALALSCQSIWHQTEALGGIALRLAEVHLWEDALETWNQAEIRWLEARVRKETTYEIEERDRRLGVLIPLCYHLVRAQQWQQAWKLCQRLEDISMRIKLGSDIATALDQLRQSEDAQSVWTQTSGLALATWPRIYNLSDLALALEKTRHRSEADVIWRAYMSDVLDADHDDVYLRTGNCSRLALEMAQRHHQEEAELLLNESIKAAVVLWEQRSGSKELRYIDL